MHCKNRLIDESKKQSAAPRPSSARTAAVPAPATVLAFSFDSVIKEIILKCAGSDYLFWNLEHFQYHDKKNTSQISKHNTLCFHLNDWNTDELDEEPKVKVFALPWIFVDQNNTHDYPENLSEV